MRLKEIIANYMSYWRDIYCKMEINKIHQGDCFELKEEIRRLYEKEKREKW